MQTVSLVYYDPLIEASHRNDIKFVSEEMLDKEKSRYAKPIARAGTVLDTVGLPFVTAHYVAPSGSSGGAVCRGAMQPGGELSVIGMHCETDLQHSGDDMFQRLPVREDEVKEEVDNVAVPMKDEEVVDEKELSDIKSELRSRASSLDDDPAKNMMNTASKARFRDVSAFFVAFPNALGAHPSGSIPREARVRSGVKNSRTVAGTMKQTSAPLPGVYYDDD